MDRNPLASSDDPSHHFQAFTGARNVGITNSSFNSAGNNLSVYEKCSFSMNSTPVADAETYDTKTFEEIANWLTKINFRDIDEEARLKRVAGTGLWFMRTEEYRRWTKEDLKIIWGKGMPGAGKTVLSAIVVDRLRKESKKIPVAFGYCRYTEKYSTSQLLAAWIRQILEYDPTALGRVRETYLVHKRQETYPAEPELHDLLSHICSTFEKVYIVLDGLDEALDDVKTTLLQAVNSLPSNTHTLIMSRPLESFEYLLEKVAFINIQARNVDVELFVQKKIDQIPRLHTLFSGKDNERERLCTAIKQKSRGMFLVASLQIEALKRSITIKALFQTLEILPSGVDDLYKLTLERIEAQGEPEASLAKRAILWLVFTFQTLTIDMLQDALAIDLDLGVFDKDGILRKELLIDICCGLVSESYSIVRLIHYTARDFFKIACSAWVPPHTHLSSSCVLYLSCLPRDKEGHYSVPTSSLLRYAEIHWAAHARMSRQESGISHHVSQFLAKESPRWWTLGRYHDLLNSEQLAAFHGLSEWLQDNGSSCDTQVTPKYGFTLLHLAAMGGHVDCAKLILERWPKISVSHRSRDRRTALMLASIFGHDEMVKFLLSVDPEEVDFPDGEGDRVLVYCVKAGHFKGFIILISQDHIDANARSLCGCTALIVGSHLRRHNFLDFLLTRREIDPTARCPTHGTTALLAAAHQLYFDTVNKIISSPICNQLNLNESAECGCNLFICASRCGNENTFRSILPLTDWQGSRNTKDCKFSRTALLWASFYGHDSIVQFLLSNPKVNLNCRDKDGNTALILAAGGGHESVVEILLASPFLRAINARNNHGDTALSLAVWYGHDRIVRLISARVDVDLACS